eukprot:SAG22_NODE_4727_length_1180_cov_1.382979_1_plen_72_part_10
MKTDDDDEEDGHGGGEAVEGIIVSFIVKVKGDHIDTDGSGGVDILELEAAAVVGADIASEELGLIVSYTAKD